MFYRLFNLIVHPCYLGAIATNSLYIFNNQYRNVVEFVGGKSKRSWIFGQKHRRISQVCKILQISILS